MSDWSIYAEQQAPRTVAAKALSASVIELPFGRRRERFMRGLATAVSALAAPGKACVNGVIRRPLTLK